MPQAGGWWIYAVCCALFLHVVEIYGIGATEEHCSGGRAVFDLEQAVRLSLLVVIQCVKHIYSEKSSSVLME